MEHGVIDGIRVFGAEDIDLSRDLREGMEVI